MSTGEEEAITLEAFNLCCGWLAGNGHAAASTALAAFLNGNAAEPPSVDATEIHTPPLNAVSAPLFGYTGDQCNGCMNFTMVRNGTCLKCTTCGSTTGCS